MEEGLVGARFEDFVTNCQIEAIGLPAKRMGLPRFAKIEPNSIAVAGLHFRGSLQAHPGDPGQVQPVGRPARRECLRTTPEAMGLPFGVVQKGDLVPRDRFDPGAIDQSLDPILSKRESAEFFPGAQLQGLCVRGDRSVEFGWIVTFHGRVPLVGRPSVEDLAAQGLEGTEDPEEGESDHDSGPKKEDRVAHAGGQGKSGCGVAADPRVAGAGQESKSQDEVEGDRRVVRGDRDETVDPRADQSAGAGGDRRSLLHRRSPSQGAPCSKSEGDHPEERQRESDPSESAEDRQRYAMWVARP